MSEGGKLCDHGLPLGKCCPCQLTISETELMRIENHLIRLLNSVAPKCEPCDSIIGLYWQIDNYVAGTKAEIAALKSDFEVLRDQRDAAWEELLNLKGVVREMAEELQDFMHCSEPPSSLNLQFFRNTFNEILNRPEVKALMQEGE